MIDFGTFYSFVIDHSFLFPSCLLCVCALYVRCTNFYFMHKNNQFWVFFCCCHVWCSYDLRMWIRFCNFLMTSIQFEYVYVLLVCACSTILPPFQHISLLVEYYACVFASGCFFPYYISSCCLLCLWRLFLDMHACVCIHTTWKLEHVSAYCDILIQNFEHFVNYCRPKCIFNIIAYDFIISKIFISIHNILFF